MKKALNISKKSRTNINHHINELIMRTLVLFAGLFLLASCAGDEAAEKKKQLDSKKNEVVQLNSEIAELEKNLENDAGHSSNINRVPVEIKSIDYGEFKHYFKANGVVESINEAFISPEINGQIKEIYVKEGDRVKKDQMLVRLNTSITDNTMKEIETALELANTIYKKQKQLWDKNIGSELQYLEAKNNKEALESRLETLKAQQDMAYVRSPIEGIVDDIFLKEGELASPGIQLMQVINLDDLYINVDIAESFLPSVNKGDVVILEFPTFPGESLKVPIHRVGNIIKKDNRTFTAQLKIRNENEKYKPNMIAVVEINDFATDSAFVVPSLIIQQDLIGTYLYVVSDQEKGLVARKRYIEPGRVYNDKSIVKEGLHPGDSVIVIGYNQVSDGSDILINNSI